MICIAPLALTYTVHYSDERHYTNAAIQMAQTNDYFTPLQDNGEPRFLKPVVTYWMIAASYKLFGISVFSSRLPFLLAGILLLFIAYRIAFRLTKNRDISLAAMLIAASNPLLILSSSRSIPDLPQTLFFSIGALGLTGIFTSAHPHKKDLWLFYMGFALAFATKGIPAAAFLFLSALFLLFNPWKKCSLKSLIHWPAILIGTIVGLWWYILMYILHGELFVISFFNDQIGERVSGNHFRIAKNTAFALLAITGYFIFWIVPLFRLKLKPFFKNPETPQKYRLFATLTGLWTIVMFLFSIFTLKFYDRYFLPVFPLISVLIAVFLFSGYNKTPVRNFSIICHILFFIGAIISIVSTVIAARLGNPVTGSISILLSALFCLRLFFPGRKGSLLSNTKTISVSILFVLLSTSLLAGNFSLPDQSKQIADWLFMHKTGIRGITYYGSGKVAAKIRVATHGTIPVKCIKPLQQFIFLSDSLAIVVREDALPRDIPNEHNRLTIASEWKSFPIHLLLFSSDLEKVKRNHTLNYKFIANSQK
jgi:4-amino-4-deoxy-L-arabinose transferase-like glycosyltransferase